MPGPEQLIRTAIALPLRITRGVIEFGLGLLPGGPPDDAAEPRTSRSTTHMRGSGTFDGEGGVEVELVAESADAEAPDSPGPQVHVDEPWEGYRRMKVDEIVGRLEGQSPEVLAAVELYETTHRHRGGILNAVRSAARD